MGMRWVRSQLAQDVEATVEELAEITANCAIESELATRMDHGKAAEVKYKVVKHY